MNVNNILEILRWSGVALGIFFGETFGKGPVDKFIILAAFCVPIIAGLTGVESVLFAKKAAEQSGYGHGGAYQRQSGFNNLALGATGLIAYFLGWGVYAMAAVMSVFLIFVTLSAANHLYTALAQGNRSLKNLLRPLLTGLLLAFTLPYLWAALAAQAK